MFGLLERDQGTKPVHTTIIPNHIELYMPNQSNTIGSARWP